MSAASLRTFLEGLDLVEYFDLLVAEGLEPADLSLLIDDDLAALGLPLGPRRRLLHAAQTRAPTPEGLGERRNLSVFFCDTVGSTVIAGRLDPEDLRALLYNLRAGAFQGAGSNPAGRVPWSGVAGVRPARVPG